MSKIIAIANQKGGGSYAEARQMMIANNRAKGDEAKFNGIVYVLVVR